MAAPESKSRNESLDNMKDSLNIRKNELEATHGHFGGKALEIKGMTAAGKMQSYQERRSKISQYNEMTERLLKSPNGGQLNNQTSSTDAPASTQRLVPADPNDDTRVYAKPGEATSSTILRFTRSNRTLHDKVKILEEEVEKYKRALDNINTDVNDISTESRSTDQRVFTLADELQIEQKNHERARCSLEYKERQVEEQAARLSELENISNETHRENLELSRRIQELNRLAEEQAATAAAAIDSMDDNPRGQICADRSGEESEKVVPEAHLEDLKRKLAETEQKLKSMSAALDFTRSKANGFQAELSRYKTWSRFWKLLCSVCWSLARAIGFMGFLLFVYLAVSEDTLRSSGIDVYRLAH